MWFAVIVFVSLSVEVLSYLTGEESRKSSSENKTSPEAA